MSQVLKSRIHSRSRHLRCRCHLRWHRGCVKQTVTLSNNAPTSLMGGTTWYLHGGDNALVFEKELKANGVTENRHYLQAAGMTFALAVSRSGAGVSTVAADRSKRPTQLSYYQQDHLGSIAAITDESGQVIERLAYDPWGKRRYPNGLGDKADGLVGVNTDRGYTLHEHLDEVGVIHMNGRVYDPLIGRFMSADPFIQSPGNLQSYNRYAYVMNNPLAYTDPSGYLSWKSVTKVFKVAAVVVIGAYTGYWAMEALIPSSLGAASVGLSAAGGAAGGFAAGFAASALNGGNLRQDISGGLQGGLTGALFGAAGGVGDAKDWSRYAAHAGAGCVSSAASGGSCGQGAASAVFGKYTTNSISGWGGDGTSGVIARGVATAVAGGVGSVIAGGKFANGAETAAFGYLFNHVLSVGGRVQASALGGGKLSAAVSYDNGQWDFGVLTEHDIPGVSIGKTLQVGLAVEVSHSTGSVESQNESQAIQFSGAAGKGGSVSIDKNGYAGASVSYGAQVGGGVSGTRTVTVFSVQRDIMPKIDSIKNWFRSNF